MPLGETLEVRTRHERRCLRLPRPVVCGQHIGFGNTEHRGVTAQVSAREDRRTERRKIIVFDGLDHDDI
jgi:hypothetical protein